MKPLHMVKTAFRENLDCNRVVSAVDLHAVITAWGECEPHLSECAADLTGDRVVNVHDLLAVLRHWTGQSPNNQV